LLRHGRSCDSEALNCHPRSVRFPLYRIGSDELAETPEPNLSQKFIGLGPS
jgi:hypothetical protein